MEFTGVKKLPPKRKNPSTSTVNKDRIFVGGVYEVHWEIGEGSFGMVFLGVHVYTRERVAIKIERLDSKVATLEGESRMLYELQGAPGIPQWKYYGEDGGNRVLVMELLGQNLEELFKLCGYRFSLKTVLMLADELVTILEHVHSRNFIHRDIKPENILTSAGNSNNFTQTINLADFGLSKRFRDPVTFEHIPYKNGRKGIVGTARYASVNCHSGREISRRDDLESLTYMLVFFLNGGRLPWQRLRTLHHKNKEDRNEIIRDTKKTMPVDVICQGCPQVIRKMLEHSRSLGFMECPDYNYLRQMLRQAMKELGIVFDGHYDWVNLPPPALQNFSPLVNNPNYQRNQNPDIGLKKHPDLDRVPFFLNGNDWSPTNLRNPNGLIPNHSSNPKGLSPINSSSPNGLSPKNSSNTNGLSPTNSSNTNGLSPTNSSNTNGLIPTNSSNRNAVCSNLQAYKYYHFLNLRRPQFQSQDQVLTNRPVGYRSGLYGPFPQQQSQIPAVQVDGDMWPRRRHHQS